MCVDLSIKCGSYLHLFTACFCSLDLPQKLQTNTCHLSTYVCLCSLDMDSCFPSREPGDLIAGCVRRDMSKGEESRFLPDGYSRLLAG